MTARDLYDHALVELNKLEAPSLLLEEYNYFMNKAVQQYVNLTYAKLEVDQQSTDDIRVLKTSAILKAKKLSEKYSEDEDTYLFYPVDMTLKECYTSLTRILPTMKKKSKTSIVVKMIRV